MTSRSNTCLSSTTEGDGRASPSAASRYEGCDSERLLWFGGNLPLISPNPGLCDGACESRPSPPPALVGVTSRSNTCMSPTTEGVGRARVEVLVEKFSVCPLLGGSTRVAYKKAARTKVVTCFIVYGWFGWLVRLKLVRLK